jgi:phage terminase large subunit-like protein
MALSNTAMPEHYGAFRAKVLRQEIPVCREIEAQMNRIDQLIADPKYYYDNKAINGFIAFCEAELTLTDGAPLEMLDSFKLWAEDLLAWFWYEEIPIYSPKRKAMVIKRVKRRLTQKQYLIVARGSAKSMYAFCLQAYFLTINPETTKQITTAPTMKQAEEVLAPFRTAIARTPGPLFELLTLGSLQNTTGNSANRQKLASTKNGIENFLTNSILEIRPMSIDKLQGLRPKICTIDEWLSGDTKEDVVAALEQGASKNDEWFIVAISSEGIVRNGTGDSMKLELAKILRGEAYAPHISIWHYKLDDIKEVGNPAMWLKANPNLGITVKYSVYQRDVERMEFAPDQKNDILAKRFGIPMEGHTYFFTYDEIQPHDPILPSSLRGMPCSLGADLSQGDDFCAFTFLFPIAENAFAVKTRSYITSLTLRKLPGALRQKYQEFIDEGSLIIMEGVTLDIDLVHEDLEAHVMERQYDIRCLGYDVYNADKFIAKHAALYGPYQIQKVIQGARTESVPLGELKILASERLLIFDELLMMFTMNHAIAVQDNNGNRKLVKRRRDEKIDNVAALMDAYVAWKAHRENF